MRTFDANKPAPVHNPFKVPDGYFEQFATNLMARISQPEKPFRELSCVRWIPWIGAACVAALFVGLMQFAPLADESSLSAPQTAQTTGSYEDTAYDYILLAEAANLTDYANDN